MSIEHRTQRVEDLSAHHLIGEILRSAHAPADLVPVPEFGRKIVVMVAHEIDALALEAFEHRHLLGRDEPAPHVAQLHMRAADIDLDLLDMGARFLKDRHGPIDHGDDPLIDREDPIVAGIGDLLAGDGFL